MTSLSRAAANLPPILPTGNPGGNPPAGNPRDGLDDQPPPFIPTVLIKFLANSVYGNLHKHLNTNYSMPLIGIERLFINLAQLETLPDPLLLDMVRVLIIEHIRNYAVQTPQGYNSISPIIDAAQLFVEMGQIKLPMNTMNLRATFIDAANRGIVTEISIQTAHIYIDEAAGPVTHLDWSRFSLTAFAPAQAPSVLTAAEIGAAVAAVMPTPPTATDLANAFAAVYPAPAANPAGRAGNAENRRQPQYRVPVFNPDNLPADVKTRYDDKLKHNLLLGSMTKVAYNGGHFYHWASGDTIILSDGTSFFKVEDAKRKGTFQSYNCL